MRVDTPTFRRPAGTGTITRREPTRPVGTRVSSNERVRKNNHYQFVCTAAVSEREELADEALDVPGVVEVRTLMTGVRNVCATAAGSDNDDVTRIALALDELGLEINRENLVDPEPDGPYSSSGSSDSDSENAVCL